jgi:hypothetical protein
MSEPVTSESEAVPTTEAASTTKAASTTETASTTEAASTTEGVPTTEAASTTEGVPTTEAASTTEAVSTTEGVSTTEAASELKAAAAAKESTRTGPGRLLVAVYGLFALSATARAVVQIATKFHHAPVAYALSALAGAVYIIATVTLTAGGPTARRIALFSCSFELAGVLAVGTWSVLDPASFPDASVWSSYGIGYGFVPLVLPVFGLLWLRRWRRRASTTS